jgi:N-hydroxyarylamine O-acetyltransferase
MNRHEYLARINYSGVIEPSFAVLAALQEAHLLAVPFENLDIHEGTRIMLDRENLFRKIVTMKRGGFCYELNTLFYHLLTDLGFNATIASGRVYDSSRNDFGPEFDHMLILAKVENRIWLVDVGFGDFSMRPLLFAENQPLMDSNGQFRIDKVPNGYFRVSRISQKDNRYVTEYIFSAEQRHIEDFSEMCSYHQTSPESHFTQKRICSIATASGRISLTDDKLIITDNGIRNESPILNEQEYRNALAKYFNIDLSPHAGSIYRRSLL